MLSAKTPRKRKRSRTNELETMSNFEDKITLQYENELVKNGIDFDNPKDVQYLYNWAKNKEKECESLKETIEELLESHTELYKVLKLLLIQSLNSRGITPAMESQVLSALQTAENIKQS